MSTKSEVSDIKNSVEKQIKIIVTNAIGAIQAVADAEVKEMERPSDMPEEGQDYWFISQHGEIGCCTWMGDQGDNLRYEMGDVFHTKEAAIKARDKQLAYMRIVRFIAAKNKEQGWVCDWADDNPKFFAFYNHGSSKIKPDWWSSFQITALELYSSPETIEASIEAHHDDYLLIWEVEG